MNGWPASAARWRPQASTRTTRSFSPGDFVYADGLACVPLLRADDRPTAIFAAATTSRSASSKQPGRSACASRRTCPSIGFDDTFAARAASPQLTTVGQPLVRVGRMAMQAAVPGDGNGPHPTAPVQLATTLVERDSTAPPAL